MVGNNNKEEKIREVAGMYHISCNFPGCNAVVMMVDMKVVYTFNQPDHIKNMRVDVDDNVDGKDNSEEMTREVADIRMYHIS